MLASAYVVALKQSTRVESRGARSIAAASAARGERGDGAH